LEKQRHVPEFRSRTLVSLAAGSRTAAGGTPDAARAGSATRAPPACATAQGRSRTRCRHCHRAREKAPGRRKKESQALAEKAEKAKKIEEAKKLAEAKAKAANEAKAEAKKLAAQKEQLAKKEAALEAKQRKENMDRINAQLGATGAADARGTAQKASGPSASYGSKVRAKVKPNIVFTEDIAGNPVAEVEVRTTPGGSITSQRLLKSSGNKAWDDAVIKAIIRTETLPLDTDGRVPTPLIIEFRPKD
jgi:colicin import membrane protein